MQKFLGMVCHSQVLENVPEVIYWSVEDKNILEQHFTLRQAPENALQKQSKKQSLKIQHLLFRYLRVYPASKMQKFLVGLSLDPLNIVSVKFGTQKFTLYCPSYIHKTFVCPPQVIS